MSLVYHHLSRPSQKVLYSQGTHHSVWKSTRGNLWKMRLLGDFQPLWAPLEREAGKAIKSGRHGSWATTIWHLLRVPNQRPFSSKKAKEKMCTGWFSSSSSFILFWTPCRYSHCRKCPLRFSSSYNFFFLSVDGRGAFLGLLCGLFGASGWPFSSKPGMSYPSSWASQSFFWHVI